MAVVRMCGWAPGGSPANVDRQARVHKLPSSIKLPLRTLTREELLELQEVAAARPHLLKRLKEEMQENGIVHSRILSAEELRRETEAAAQAFVVPYRGDGMETLKKGLNWRLSNPPEESFCQVVVAINSPGMGKTRTALELGARGDIFVFYCSLASSTASTIPVQTPILAEKLVKTVTTWEMGLYFVSWLEVLSLHLVRGDLGSLEQAPAKWLERQDLTSMSCSGHLQKEVGERWLELEKKWKVRLSQESEQSDQEKAIQQLVKDASGKVLQQLGYVGKQLKLLFVVDEVTALLRPRGLSSYEHYPYLALRRGASRMGPSTLVLAMGYHGIRFGAVRLFGGRPEQQNLSGIKKQLKPLWHCGSMDSQGHPDDSSHWKQDPTGWLVSMDRLSRYGRPLWYSWYANRQDENDLIEFATSKLLNIDGAPKKPGVVTMEQAIALLRFTVGLEINPRAELAEAMVSGHMSTLVLMGDEGRAVWTVAASEPVLSEAASRWLQEPALLSDALKHLAMALNLHSVNAGDRGELVSGILIMMAMWQCQAASGARKLSPVKVMDYLRRALGDDLDDIPFLADGLVFFNRIVAIDHVPSQLELMEHFKRGQMLCGTLSNSIAAADKWIPVWDGTEMEAQHFSCIMISDKNKNRPSEPADANKKMSVEYVGILGISKLGYVTWIHDLRLEENVYRSQVYKDNTRVGFKLQGLSKSPVFQAGAIKDYASSLEGLRKLLAPEPYAGADEEDEEFIRRCSPWMFQKYLPTNIKASVERQEKETSTCSRCARVFKSPVGLRRHRCKIGISVAVTAPAK